MSLVTFQVVASDRALHNDLFEEISLKYKLNCEIQNFRVFVYYQKKFLRLSKYFFSSTSTTANRPDSTAKSFLCVFPSDKAEFFVS